MSPQGLGGVDALAALWVAELLGPGGGVFGPHTGKGSRDAAAAEAKAAGVCAPLLLQVGADRAHWAFASTDARRLFLEKHRGQQLLEVVDGTRPHRPALDIDGPASFTEDDIDEAADIFGELAIELGIDPDDAPPQVCVAKRADKVSAHIVAQWEADPEAVRGFLEEVARRCPPKFHEPLPNGGAILDTKATSGPGFWSLRLPFGPKLSKGQPIPGSELEPLPGGWAGGYSPAVNELAGWCLQGCEALPRLYSSAPKSAAGEGCEAPAEDQQADDPPAEDVRQALAKGCAEFLERFPHFTRDAEADAGALASYTNKGQNPAKPCPTCKRIHKQPRGAYVVRCGAWLVWRCRRHAEGAESLHRHHIGKAQPRGAVVDGWNALDDTEADAVANERYVADAFEYRYGSEFARGADLYIRSSWNTGKSHFILALVRRLLAENPRAKILAPTSRKSLSSQLFTDFAKPAAKGGAGASVCLYSDAVGALSADALSEYNVLVCQLESLERLADGLEWDLVITDEPNALRSHVWLAGGNRKAANGLTILGNQIRRAGRLIVSDHDLSRETRDAFKLLRGRHPSRTLVNRYKPWAGTPVKIFTGATGPAETRRRLFEDLEAQNAKRLAGQAWGTLKAPCHSRRYAEGLAEEAEALYGKGLVKLYTAESCDHEKKRDFADATRAWGGDADGNGRPLLIIYTACVSCGVSANTPDIVGFYAFFTSKNAAAGQSLQMLARARQTRYGFVSYVGEAAASAPTSAAGLYEWASRAANRQHLPDEYRPDRCAHAAAAMQGREGAEALGGLVYSVFEGRLWVEEMLERNRSAAAFVPHLVHGLTGAGFVVEVVDASGKLAAAAETLGVDAADLLDTKKRAADHQGTAAAKRIEEAAEAYPEALERYQDEEGQTVYRLRTQKEHRGEWGLSTAIAYAGGGAFSLEAVAGLDDEPREEWLKYHGEQKELAQAYRDLTAIARGHDQERGPDHTGGTQTAITSQSERCAIVRTVCAVLGLSHALETGEPGEVRADVVRKPSAELLAAVEMANTHAARVFGDSHGSRRRAAIKAAQKAGKPPPVMGSVSAVLGAVGGWLSPVYDTARERARRSAPRFRLRWKFQERNDEGQPAAEPVPGHPTRLQRL